MNDVPATQETALNRREVVRRLVEVRTDLVVFSSLGSPTYDLAAAGDHPKNFYLWGAMGGAAVAGLGFALARPDAPVAVIIGDGECLMGIGSFATIALQKPSNLAVIVLDNGLYGETGSQRSHTSGGMTDLAAVARGCGIRNARTVSTAAEIDSLVQDVNRIGEGPLVAVIKIDGAEMPRCLPMRDGVALKNRLRAAIGLECL